MNHLLPLSIPTSPGQQAQRQQQRQQRSISVDGASCLTPPSAIVSPAESRKEPDAISPPDNFAVIETGLYRSGLPSSRTITSFILSLNLRTVIILSSEKPTRSLSSLSATHDIRVIHTGLTGWTSQRTSWKPIAEEVVKETLELILCRDNYPVLMCDVDGVYLVGMVVGCLRKLQGWNLNSIVNEYRLFAASKTRYINEQFIEFFDIDLITIPPLNDLPKWFRDHVELDCKERQELLHLMQNGLVDECGTLIVNQQRQQQHQQQQLNQQQLAVTSVATPNYVVYYYSSSCPLNSQAGSFKPRIEKF